MNNYDPRLLTEAFRAATNSPDPRTQIGAVVSGFDSEGRYQHVSDCNYFPYQPDHLTREQMLASPEKYNWVEHAERTSIYHACKAGIRPAVMHCTLAACLPCARAILLSGIKEVYCHQALYNVDLPNWKEQVDASIKMFETMGVAYFLVNDLLDVPTIRYNGEMFDLKERLVQG